MLLVSVVVAALLAAGPAPPLQDTGTPQKDAETSGSQDGRSNTAPPYSTASSKAEPSPQTGPASQTPAPSGTPSGVPASPETTGPAGTQVDLPVSLDHIREALKKAPDQSLLRITELPADFRVVILEQQRINEIMSKLDFKSGPAPGGGLYGYDQQRRLFNPTDRPLMQPYAAFSGGEFFTIAIENLIKEYLGGRLVNAVGGAARGRAERAAREEVERAIADYCASRPDRANIHICTTSGSESASPDR
jgi:hypothetical protein